MLKQLDFFINKLGLIFIRQVEVIEPKSEGCIEITIPINLPLIEFEKGIAALLDKIRLEIAAQQTTININCEILKSLN